MIPEEGDESDEVSAREDAASIAEGEEDGGRGGGETDAHEVEGHAPARVGGDATSNMASGLTTAGGMAATRPGITRERFIDEDDVTPVKPMHVGERIRNRLSTQRQEQMLPKQVSAQADLDESLAVLPPFSPIAAPIGNTPAIVEALAEIGKDGEHDLDAVGGAGTAAAAAKRRRSAPIVFPADADDGIKAVSKDTVEAPGLRTTATAATTTAKDVVTHLLSGTTASRRSPGRSSGRESGSEAKSSSREVSSADERGSKSPTKASTRSPPKTTATLASGSSLSALTSPRRQSGLGAGSGNGASSGSDSTKSPRGQRTPQAGQLTQLPPASIRVHEEESSRSAAAAADTSFVRALDDELEAAASSASPISTRGSPRTQSPSRSPVSTSSRRVSDTPPRFVGEDVETDVEMDVGLPTPMKPDTPQSASGSDTSKGTVRKSLPMSVTTSPLPNAKADQPQPLETVSLGSKRKESLRAPSPAKPVKRPTLPSPPRPSAEDMEAEEPLYSNVEYENMEQGGDETEPESPRPARAKASGSKQESSSLEAPKGKRGRPPGSGASKGNRRSTILRVGERLLEEKALAEYAHAGDGETTDEEDEAALAMGLRRSRRKRFPPLAFWANEHLKYRRTGEGLGEIVPEVVGVERLSSPAVPKTRQRRKTTSRERTTSSKEDLEKGRKQALVLIEKPDSGSETEVDEDMKDYKANLRKKLKQGAKLESPPEVREAKKKVAPSKKGRHIVSLEHELQEQILDSDDSDADGGRSPALGSTQDFVNEALPRGVKPAYQRDNFRVVFWVSDPAGMIQPQDAEDGSGGAIETRDGERFAELTCVKSRDMVQLESLFDDRDGVNGSTIPLAGKTFQGDNFSSGFLDLLPGGVKPFEMSDQIELFYVISAEPEKLRLTIQNQQTLLCKGDSVMIPICNLYQLENLSTTQTARLMFTLVDPPPSVIAAVQQKMEGLQSPSSQSQ